MTKANFNLKQNPKPKIFKRNIAIIGAGITGCSLAKKLNDVSLYNFDENPLIPNFLSKIVRCLQ